MSQPHDPPALLTALRARIADGDVPEFDPVRLNQTDMPGWAPEQLTIALETLTAEDALTRADVWLCPVAACGLPISREDIALQRCPHCTTDFRTLDDPEPIRRTVYRRAGPLSRDLQWAVVIHGMNTFGPWQEAFSWRLALKLRYSAPVLIHKYEMVRFGVLFRARHRDLVAELGHRLEESFPLIAATGRTRPPDVILHSFGTLLFAKLLDDPAFNALRFGRVILAGSIVRPDHAWGRHIEAGRIEAILNHCGSADGIVSLAHYAIPDTGPSGRLGLVDPAVLNIRAEGYDHSAFFKDQGLDENLAPGGVWDRFLRVPLRALEESRMDTGPAAAWHPPPPPLRRIALPVFIVLTGVATISAVLGAIWLGNRLFS